jgi:hypothetical protein
MAASRTRSFCGVLIALGMALHPVCSQTAVVVASRVGGPYSLSDCCAAMLHAAGMCTPASCNGFRHGAGLHVLDCMMHLLELQAVTSCKSYASEAIFWPA